MTLEDSTDVQGNDSEGDKYCANDLEKKYPCQENQQVHFNNSNAKFDDGEGNLGEHRKRENQKQLQNTSNYNMPSKVAVTDQTLNEHHLDSRTNNELNAKKGSCCAGCCRNISSFIVRKFESGFYKLGIMIGSHPVITIGIAFLIAGLCCLGLLNFTQENRGEKLWVPDGSETVKHLDWVNKAFPEQSRLLRVLCESKTGNILTNAGLKQVLKTHKEVLLVNNGTQNDWKRICFRRGPFCFMSGILEVWGFNESIINSLTDSEIMKTVNKPVLLSPITGRPIYLSTVLGSVTRSGGKILTAEVALSTYFLKLQNVFQPSSGRQVDEVGEKFEESFGKAMKKNYDGLNVYFYSRRSFSQASGDSIQGDIQLLSIGYILIILYLALMLGKFTVLQLKTWLAVGGVFCIVLSIGVSFGLSSAFGVFYGPVHSVLPFLLLGIGVDDIFVIVQAWETTAKRSASDLQIPFRIGNTIKVAGVAITVTSLTDMIAFLIGATTILPALRSFCIFAGLGILAVFFLTCSFFVGCLAIDALRIKVRRNACCCCLVVSEEKAEPTGCAKNSYLNMFFEKIYAKYLLTTPSKIIVLFVTAAVLGVGLYGITKLEQKFDPNWFLPPKSDAMKYSTASAKHFPSEGVKAAVYIGEVDYFKYQDQLESLRTKITQNKYVSSDSVTSWYHQYKKWILNLNSSHPHISQDGKISNETTFYIFLKKYISRDGSSFKKDIQFENITFSNKIRASKIELTHKLLKSSAEEIKALDTLQDEVGKFTFGGTFKPFSYARRYLNWETNKVISKELFRNLLLASVCVFVVTLFLIANIWVSIMVFTCVVLTLVDVAAMMHFWGLTIDTVTTIMLILSIGLCVDYAAHIGHSFMVARRGDRNERATAALVEIGPAVFNGGVSTFLAFVLLGASNSYVFKTFFKVFFLVVIFGQFHGLVYFPVVLSLIGPKAYGTDNESPSVTPSSSIRKKQEENGNVHYYAKTTDESKENQGYQNSVENLHKLPDA